MDTSNKEDRSERLIEAALAILQASDAHELNITVLNKALFYLDLLTLRDTGETATHATYLALKQGPVVANYEKRLVKPLVSRGLARQEAIGEAKPVRLLEDVAALQFRCLDQEAVNLAHEVGKRFSRFTSKRVSDYSHENPAWRIAYDHWQGRGGPAEPIDMILAMQQLDCDDDPWMNEEADDELKAAFKEAASL